MILKQNGEPVDLIWDSGKNLSLFLESAPMAIVTINQVGHILFVNARLEKMFGYSRVELIGQSVETLLPDRFQKAHTKYRADYVVHPRVRPMGSGLDLAARHKNGTEIPVEVGLSYIKANNELLVMGSIIDISLRKQTEASFEQRVKERTKEIERRRQVADGLRDILAVLNSSRSLEDIINFIVAQAIRHLDANGSAVYRLHNEGSLLTIGTSQGLTSEYIALGDILLNQGTTGQAVATRRPVATSDVTQVLTEGSPETQSRRQALLACGYHAVLAVPLLVKDEVYGALVLYYAQPRRFFDDEIELAVTFADQAALAIENARLRTQVEQTAIAAERSRLARDLHDAVTQTLFSASLIAEVLPRLWERNPDETRRRLEELRQLTRGALAEMRTLLLELRPSKLTEVKLGDLLRQLTEAITGRARVPIALEVAGHCTLLPDVQVALYRIAQETLNNVAKHAHAGQVTVSLHCQPARITLTINDDGRGFNLEAIPPNSLGLSIMRERADAIGALLEIKSAAGQGTRVAVLWENKEATKDK